MAFGILKRDSNEFSALFSPDFAKVDFVGMEISFEAFEVFGEKRNFREQICGKRVGRFFEGDALAAG